MITEKENEEDEENESDEEVHFDLDEAIQTFKYVLKKLTVKDFIIMLLILMMFLIYIIHNNYIDACNAYYRNLLRNTTQLATSLW